MSYGILKKPLLDREGNRWPNAGPAEQVVEATARSLPIPLREARRYRLTPSAEAVAKRTLDLVLASLLLVLLFPLFVLVAVLVRWTSPGPVIVAQPRIGYRHRKFLMFKFRSMVEGAEKAETLLAEQFRYRPFFKDRNDPRVTRLGRLLRKYSLDELPQLLNVLRGEMSLVGPRPLLPSDLQRFPTAGLARRFSALPGMTGLWQVSGRSKCSDKKRLQLDIDYVQHRSLWLDLKILARTVIAVITAEGAY